MHFVVDVPKLHITNEMYLEPTRQSCMYMSSVHFMHSTSNGKASCPFALPTSIDRLALAARAMRISFVPRSFVNRMKVSMPGLDAQMR